MLGNQNPKRNNFGQMIPRFPQALRDSRHDFDIDAQVLRQAIGRLQLIKPLEDSNLSPQPTQTSAFAAELTFHIASNRVQDLKGYTKNALAAQQKLAAQLKTMCRPVTMPLFF